MAAAVERETVITFNDEDDNAVVYTANSRIAEMLISRGIKPIKIDTYRKQQVGWTFEMPKWAVRLKPSKLAINVGGSKIKKSGSPDATTPTAEEAESN